MPVSPARERSLKVNRVATRPAPLAALVACLVITSGSALAGADEGATSKETCATSYEDGQRLRREAKLMQARAAFGQCADACPAQLSADCVGWLAEIESSMPSLIVQAYDAAGKAVPRADIRVDGLDVESIADGKTPVLVDPGARNLRVELPSGETREMTVGVRPGDRKRRIEIRFARSSPSAPVSAVVPSSHPIASRAQSRGSIWPWVLGGGAAASLTTAAAFTIAGHAKRGALFDTCAPTCAQSDVDSIRTMWVVGGVFAALGVGLGSGAAVLALSSKGSETRRQGRRAWRLVARGAHLELTHTF